MEAFCILAAGRGLRCQGMNRLHKCLLPINNKAVISHIIDKAPKDAEIIVAVGHQAKLVEEYCQAAHPERHITYVAVDNYDGPGSGPGYSLQCCKDLLQRPFYLVCSDCIVTEDLPDLSKNWIGVFPVNDPIHWSTAQVYEGKIISFKNKAADGYEYAWIGVAGIKEYDVFWSQMKHTDKEFEMVSAFYEPEKYTEELYSHLFSWFDTGTPENYNKSKSTLGQTSLGMAKEIDEITYKVDDRCVKVFGDAQIAAGRIERAKWLSGLIPEMKFSGTHVYAYKWMRGGTMYEVGTLELFNQFLNWCEIYLWRPTEWSSSALSGVFTENFRDLCYKFYHDKTLGRLKAYLKKKGLERDKEETIRGRSCKAAEEYLEKLDWKRLCNGMPVLFHGDLQFENILYSDGKFCLIDWRDSFANERSCGDLYYDFAKLYGGLGMCYQKIKEGKFHVDEETYTFEMPTYLEDMRNCFENWLLKKCYDLYKVKVLAALIYLNMAPLHTPDFDRLLFCHSKYLMSTL